MKVWLTRAIVALALFLFLAVPVFAPPAPMTRWTPGEELGETASSWIGPYTLYRRLKIGNVDEESVQWFSRDGSLLRELGNVSRNVAGFVSRSDSTGQLLVSVANPRWEVLLKPRREEPGGRILSTADGRTLVFSSRSSWSEYDEWPRVPTTLDLYIEGERKTLGPYPGGPREFYLGADGTLAVHFLTGMLIVADRNGREVFRTTVQPSRENRLLACSDRGILWGSHDQTKPIEYHGFDGTRTSFTIPGHLRVHWTAGDRALIHTTPDSLLLVDCAKGRVVWGRPYPSKRAMDGSTLYGIVGPYLVAAANEIRASDAQRAAVGLRAFDLETGELVASWGLGCGTEHRAAHLQFFRHNGQLMFSDGTRFSAIEPEDIANEREGWCSNRPPPPPPQLFEEGAAASPLSWKPIRSRREAASSPFAPRQRIANVDLQESSVDLVHFNDDRPYSELKRRKAWIARYDSVPVHAKDGRGAIVSLSAAYDAETGNLVCAFTDAAPRWIRSRHKPIDIEARVMSSRGDSMAAADYESLRSTPAEVLGALLDTFFEPFTAGQIILRPRFVTRKFPARRFEGNLIPTIPPSNSWIVEVLGMKADFEYGYATQVIQFRDDTLDMITGQPMP